MKKRGFTLVELLGVIVILVIVLGIAVVGYIKITEGIKISFYKGVEESISLASGEYYNYNDEKAPTIFGDAQKVTVKELIDGGFIDEVLDRNKQSCDIEGSTASYAIAYKNSYDKINYSVCLICSKDNYKSDCNEVDDYTLKMTATIGNTKNVYKEGKWINQNVVLNFKTQNDIKTIEVNGNGETKRCTVNKEKNINQCDITIEKSGEYTAVGIAENGNKTSSKSISIKIDKTSPTYDIYDESKTNKISNTEIERNDYNVQSVLITNYIKDVNDTGSGIEIIRYSFEKKGEKEKYITIEEEKKIEKEISIGEWELKVEVKDKAGNSTTKNVIYKLMPSYTVSYNSNGGTGSMENSTAIYNNNFVTRPNAFTKRGYKFDGWNEKADGTGSAWKLTYTGIYENGNGSHPWKWTYTNSITLYAQWKPINYYIRYHGNGGTSSDTEPWTSKAFSYGTSYSKIVENNWYTRSGYTFAGWSPVPENGNVNWWPAGYPSSTTQWIWIDGEYGIGNEQEHYLDLYAKWTAKTYTVKYNCNGGNKPSGKLGDATATYNQNFIVSSDKCERSGYVFKGWKDSTGDSSWTGWSGKWVYDNGKYGISNNTLTLYAEWQPINYYIRYHGNGGTSSYTEPWTSKAFSYGTSYSKIVENNWYTRSGYTFAGWSPVPENGNVNWWPAGYPSSTTQWIWIDGQFGIGNEQEHYLDLYAKWIAKTYTVKYNCNGGNKPSGKLGDATATYNQNFTVSSDKCERSGYVFKGWKDSTGDSSWTGWSGKWVYDNGKYGISNNTLTLYAEWESKPAAIITCTNPTYTGSYLTIATCSGGSITSGGSRKDIGSQTVTCTGDSNHTTATKSCSVVQPPTLTVNNTVQNKTNQTAAYIRVRCNATDGVKTFTDNGTVLTRVEENDTDKNETTYLAFVKLNPINGKVELSCTSNSGGVATNNITYTWSRNSDCGVQSSSTTYSGTCTCQYTLSSAGTNKLSKTIGCETALKGGGCWATCEVNISGNLISAPSTCKSSTSTTYKYCWHK